MNDCSGGRGSAPREDGDACDAEPDRRGRLVFVTAYDPTVSELGGGSWVDRKLIAELSRSHRVVVFPVAAQGLGDANHPPLEIRNSRSAVLRTVTRMIVRREPYLAAKFRHSARWRTRGRDLTELLTPEDVVVTSQWPALLLVFDNNINPNIHFAHNVDAVLASAYDPLAFRLVRNQRRLSTLENRMLRQARRVMCLSSHDVRELRSQGLDAEQVVLRPSTTDAHAEKKLRGRGIGFLGKLAWPPNQEAADRLIFDVLPALRQRMGTAAPTVIAAGSGTEKLQNISGVSGMGKVADLTEFYSQINVACIPRTGVRSGISVKLAEALELGIPAVGPRELIDDMGWSTDIFLAGNTAEEIAAKLVEFYEGDRNYSPEIKAEVTYLSTRVSEGPKQTAPAVKRTIREMHETITEKILSGQREFESRMLDTSGCRVQTINLHHLYLASRDDAFYAAMRDADYVTADGWPVRTYLASCGIKVSRATGSAFVQAFTENRTSQRIGLIAASEDSGRRFEARLSQVGNVLAFREHGHYNDWRPEDLVRDMRAARVDVCLVAVTPPRGDVLAHALSLKGFEGKIVAVGGAVDAASGVRRRAPRIVLRTNTEWIFRLVQDPNHLFKRYILECAPFLLFELFPAILRERVGMFISRRTEA